jgi:hypothetical protein
MATRLWVLRRVGGEGTPIYDCNDGFVIRADDATEARMMASKTSGDEGPNVWLNADQSHCEELLQFGEPGIIITDFHAG